MRLYGTVLLETNGSRYVKLILYSPNLQDIDHTKYTVPEKRLGATFSVIDGGGRTREPAHSSSYAQRDIAIAYPGDLIAPDQVTWARLWGWHDTHAVKDSEEEPTHSLSLPLGRVRNPHF